MKALNCLCRICGVEDKKCIPVFSETGKRQAIQKKIHSCLPLKIEETDGLPSQICLSCLSKLDVSWDLVMLCKRGQEIIDQRVLELELAERKEKVIRSDTIEEKVRSLSVKQWVTYGDSAIISLAPKSPPPAPSNVNPTEAPPVLPTTSGTVGVMQTPGVMVSPAVTYMQPSSAMSMAQPEPAIPVPMPLPAPAKDNVYPEGLIQVNSANKPVLYRNEQRQERRQASVTPRRSVPAPRPVPLPRRLPPVPAKRQSLSDRDSPTVPQPKRSNQLCKYCNKTFPDDIIDHHVNLHLRQSFFTCLDCNKNFRSEQAMSRHRCSDTINLDPDDEPICV